MMSGKKEAIKSITFLLHRDSGNSVKKMGISIKRHIQACIVSVVKYFMNVMSLMKMGNAMNIQAKN